MNPGRNPFSNSGIKIEPIPHPNELEAVRTLLADVVRPDLVAHYANPADMSAAELASAARWTILGLAGDEPVSFAPITEAANTLSDALRPEPPPSAEDLLIEAADCIGDRASQRDTPAGERSMARAADMFNAWRGAAAGPVTETEGWVFMALLKLSRARSGAYRRDDYVDGAAYVALAGECEAAHTTAPATPPTQT